MDHTNVRRANARAKRVLRVRKKLRGTLERPRLSVSKTNLHLYAQLIDDERGVTLVGVGTLSKSSRAANLNKKSKEAAKAIGIQIGELAKKLNIQTVVFDRGRYKYHGHIAELATGAREAGLQF